MAIRFDKLTLKAQEAVQRANDLASEHGNPEVMPVHLLGALIEDKEGIVPPVLEKIGISPQAVLNDLYREIEKLPKVSGGTSVQASFSPVIRPRSSRVSSPRSIRARSSSRRRYSQVACTTRIR